MENQEQKTENVSKGAEQILKKYKGIRESWVPHGPINLFGDRAIISAMHEYAQLERLKARNEAIQECIDIYKMNEWYDTILEKFEKLKSKTI